jgi:predicted RNA-binding Zn-ribbon protein involved in translation (DUF1610 family)
MQMQVREECPSCGKNAKIPPDADGEAVFPCFACGTRLVVKAAVFEEPVRVWLVTLDDERKAALTRRDARNGK